MKIAVGILIKDRWNLTEKTLVSLSKSKQSNYDLFIVDNGSASQNVDRLKKLLSSIKLPLKQVFFIDDSPISIAWNLFFYQARKYHYLFKIDNDVETPKQYRKFISKSIQWMKQNKVQLGSIVPVHKGLDYKTMLVEIDGLHERGLPYLYGACMIFDRKCIQTLGYMDERIKRRIDVDYCHRAVRYGFKIGYIPDIWLQHLGAGNPTEGKDEMRKRYRHALKMRSSKSATQTRWAKQEIPNDSIVDLRS